MEKMETRHKALGLSSRSLIRDKAETRQRQDRDKTFDFSVTPVEID